MDLIQTRKIITAVRGKKQIPLIPYLSHPIYSINIILNNKSIKQNRFRLFDVYNKQPITNYATCNLFFEFLEETKLTQITAMLKDSESKKCIDILSKTNKDYNFITKLSPNIVLEFENCIDEDINLALNGYRCVLVNDTVLNFAYI